MQKLAVNPFTQALKERRTQIGLWSSLCSNLCAEVIAPSGYDWVLIDMEHSPNDLQSVMSQLHVYEASNTLAIVRPQWNDSVLIKRLLDLGVPGLLIPMVQNLEEAKLAVAATRYPPKGMRGVAGSSRATKFGRISDYVSEVENQTTVILQLETISALAHAEEISQLDGVSGILFGPGDIAADMGLVGQPMNDAVWDKILPVADQLIANDIAVGTLVLDSAFATKLLNRGFSFVACGADTALFANAADQLLADVKQGLTKK